MKYLIYILAAIALIAMISTPIWSLWIMYPYLMQGGIFIWIAANGAVFFFLKEMLQWRFRDWPTPESLPEEESIV